MRSGWGASVDSQGAGPRQSPSYSEPTWASRECVLQTLRITAAMLGKERSWELIEYLIKIRESLKGGERQRTT